METRKKLLLPAGCRVSGQKKNGTTLVVLLTLMLAVIITGYFSLLTSEKTISTSAFICGSPLKILARNSGLIEYAAKAGQPVSAGEVVLRMNTSEYEQAAKNAQDIVSRQAGTLPKRSRDLMLHYLSIPQSVTELAENLQKTAASEKMRNEELAGMTERQAVFGIELRRLELKRARLAEEKARMEAMRVEEELLRESLRRAEKDFEMASLERSAAAKLLQTKRDLEQTLLSLPLAQREQLYALEAEFYKIHEAERQIVLASVTSPQNGRVMYTALETGSVANEHDVALYILPDENPDVWVTAYFSPQDADKMQLGRDCTVTVGGASTSELQGIVAERMPEIEQGPTGETPFKIKFSNLETTQFVGINPALPVSVSFKN